MQRREHALYALKLVGLEGYGLEITGRVPLLAETTPENRAYLATKRDKMGHLLTLRPPAPARSGAKGKKR